MTAPVDLNPKERFEGVPKGFICNAKGVIQLGDDDKRTQLTTKPIVVRASTHDVNRENWGVHLWWLDQDDHSHERTVPKRLFHGEAAALAQMLADGGLPIMPRRENGLITYLALFNPVQRLWAADRTGWLNDAFVLPKETLRQPEGKLIVYQPSGLSNHMRVMHRQGSLEQWQEGIMEVSPLIKFAVCASLSAPVRYPCGVEAGGFHLWGKSSHGKTTALQAGASCWGNGGDPMREGGANCYINRWNATDNALEAKSEMHNDLPMIVDEIGESDSKEFGRTIYKIFSGQGRDRSGRSGELRDSKSWRVSVLSAGEMAVAEFIGQGGGKVKGGQLVRLIDVDVSKAPPITQGADDSDRIKRLCAEHFGMAGPELLVRIDDLTEGWQELDHEQLGPASTPLAKRARHRFALVWHTGLLAIKAGVLPWSEADILNTVSMVYGIWLEQINTVSDEHRGITAVTSFILANESRFERGNETFPVHNRVGWIRDGRYCFTMEGFKEACNGVNPGQTKQALKDAKLLHHTKGMNAYIRVNGQNTGVVAVKAEILSWFSSFDGSDGSSGSTHVATGVTAASSAQNAAEAAEAGQGEYGVLTPSAPSDLYQAGAAESPVDTGLLPPLPVLPSKNDKPKRHREVI